MPGAVPSGVHGVRGHIIIDDLAVLLFLLLNVIEDIARIGVAEFEYARVVQVRGVLFHREHVRAQVAVVLLLRGLGVVVGRREGRRHGRGVRRGGDGAALHLCDRVEMLLLDLCDLFEQVSQLGVIGVGGVAVVLVHAQLLLSFEIFE